jgi:hypothetical protein
LLTALLAAAALLAATLLLAATALFVAIALLPATALFVTITLFVAIALLISWLWTALAAAGAHFVTALISLVVARSRISKAVFRAASSALREDREWLKNLNATNQPTS